MSQHFEVGRDLFGLIIVVLLEALFLHLAAKFLTANPRYIQAVLVAVLGGILAGVVLVLVPSTVWGLVLAALTWLVVCATIYRIGLVRSLLLGVLAAILFVLVIWLIRLVAAAMKNGASPG